MWTDLRQHRFAYIILILELFVFVLLFMAAWPNRLLQRLLILELLAFYILWGWLTHRKLGHPWKPIVAEYAGVAGMAAVILFLLTW